MKNFKFCGCCLGNKRIYFLIRLMFAHTIRQQNFLHQGLKRPSNGRTEETSKFTLFFSCFYLGFFLRQVLCWKNMNFFLSTNFILKFVEKNLAFLTQQAQKIRVLDGTDGNMKNCSDGRKR